MRFDSMIRFGLGLAAVWTACSSEAGAAETLVGHASSVTRFKGDPAVGTQFKITIRAGKNGTPEVLPVPVDPVSQGGSVSVTRDGGTVRDLLGGGVWTGIGNPPGSKGWKYKNKNAPGTGVVSAMSLTAKGIKVTAKGTGSMPAPAAPNGLIQAVIVADGETYCAEALPPYDKEVDGQKIQSKNQMPPAACPSCLLGADLDGDRLDDCYETDTGVFVDASDTGTDPLNADTDEDGLDDGDEVLGTTAGLDLPALGTSPLRRDILVEYDWFDDSLECGAHSHEPTAGSLALVTAAFAAAPLSNPDGSTGINFIHDRGQGGVFDGGNFISDANGVLVGGVNNAEFIAYKSLNFASNRHGYFHYTILPHRYDTNSGSSGQAEIVGDDMIVSLYCAGSDHNVGHTIMHELGHNLGLFHGGGDGCNYKPNYNSVMNYLYQFPGVDADCDPPGDGVLDYSIGDRLTLNENNLDENLGTCGAPEWDWDGNTTIETGVVADINSSEPEQAMWCQGTLSTLRDWNDWERLYFGGLADGDGAAVAQTRIIDCDNPAPMTLP